MSKFSHLRRLESESTNTELVALAKAGAAELTLLSAIQQSAGHGQYGRAFASPRGGAYFSLLLRPEPYPDIAEHLTAIAAVAVCEISEERYGVHAGIKARNDVLVNRKKASGILVEAFDGADGFFAVVGIGVNLVTPSDGFPEELQHIGAVTDRTCNQIEDDEITTFIFDVADRFLDYYQNRSLELALGEYDARLEPAPY